MRLLVRRHVGPLSGRIFSRSHGFSVDIDRTLPSMGYISYPTTQGISHRAAISMQRETVAAESQPDHHRERSREDREQRGFLAADPCAENSHNSWDFRGAPSRLLGRGIELGDRGEKETSPGSAPRCGSALHRRAASSIGGEHFSLPKPRLPLLPTVTAASDMYRSCGLLRKEEDNT